MLAMLRLFWPSLLGPPPALLSLLLIVPAAWYGGLRPGLLATLLCVSATALAPAPRPGVPAAVTLALLACMGTGASILLARYRGLRSDQETERRTRPDAAALTARFLESVGGTAVCSLSTLGYVTGWNAAAARLLGLPAEEMLGRHFCRLYSEQEMRLNAPERELAHAADFGLYEATEWRARADGSPIRVTWSLARVLGSRGEVTGFLLTMRDVTEAYREQETLRHSLEELRDLASHLHAVREAERGRIAQEMHDELGQTLTCLRMEISALLQDGSPADARETKQLLLGQLDAAIRSMRRLSTELRPRILDELGLSAAVEWQADEFQSRTGIACSLQQPLPEVALDKERSSALFRIFQEALTNVARHSGATRVDVLLAQTPDGITLDIQDDGCGFDPQRSDRRSMGLLGMRERAISFGGRVEVASTPGHGTRVRVSIPTPVPAPLTALSRPL